ncbi:hypothetical protein [Chlamydia pecorum]|uniref:Uncharacterized protein n=1 Tax=Chlamydia pecorum (strain ATCC VR-628 / DSM 29919 / E58) TaxID=331635 RepID=A0AA34RDA0_CHLPE|nr:hypothetical protein [Chlamydia pecorum]AEB41581.1 hypothetical protein G5S_0618 [Chlamydia pecorum E58]
MSKKLFELCSRLFTKDIRSPISLHASSDSWQIFMPDTLLVRIGTPDILSRNV